MLSYYLQVLLFCAVVLFNFLTKSSTYCEARNHSNFSSYLLWLLQIKKYNQINTRRLISENIHDFFFCKKCIAFKPFGTGENTISLISMRRPWQIAVRLQIRNMLPSQCPGRKSLEGRQSSQVEEPRDLI